MHLVVEAEPEWMAVGACKAHPTDLFFPSGVEGVNEAIAICNGCPVRRACLEYALAHHIDHGIWGGCSERERRRIASRRRGHRLIA